MATEREQAAVGLAPGTVVDGRYKVIRTLGQGGAGYVHEVEHTRTGRRMAMKTLLDEAGLKRLEQEARATSLLKNTHALRITDMGRDRNAGSYMVMDLLEGQSLRDLLDEAGQLPLELTANIALQLCECLAEAHARSIVHRDIKPDNVFLCASPWPGQYDVKVLDFGVVKVFGDGIIPESSLTRTGSTVGTPYYMSLEQLRSSSAVDARADVYSLGVVLYECLSGRKPFVAETIGDLVFALCSGPPTHLRRLRPDLPEDLTELVMRSLRMNREERPSSMTEVAMGLLDYAEPAFALWIMENGKPVALRRAERRSAPAPSFEAKPPGAIANATMTAKFSTEDAWSSIGAASDEGSGARRDTPTEMYVRGAHGELQEDRETPTRALDLGGVAFAPTVQAPQGQPYAPHVRGDLPPGKPPPGATSTSPLALSPLAALSGSPVGSTLRLNDPAPRGPSPAHQPAPADAAQQAWPQAPAPSSSSPVAPAAPPHAQRFQATLDRGLASIGAIAEDLYKKLLASPPGVKIAVVVLAGVLAIVPLILVIVILVR